MHGLPPSESQVSRGRSYSDSGNVARRLLARRSSSSADMCAAKVGGSDVSALLDSMSLRTRAQRVGKSAERPVSALEVRISHSMRRGRSEAGSVPARALHLKLSMVTAGSSARIGGRAVKAFARRKRVLRLGKCARKGGRVERALWARSRSVRREAESGSRRRCVCSEEGSARSPHEERSSAVAVAPCAKKARMRASASGVGAGAAIGRGWNGEGVAGRALREGTAKVQACGDVGDGG